MTGPIGLELAQRIVLAAIRRAAELGVLVTAAVVDEGGNLVAFARMDGAEIAGATLAVDKAYTAVAHRIPTDELALLAAPGGELFGLHANGGGRYVIFGGGVPLTTSAGRVIGGVGISGARAAEDADCARVAADLARSGTT